MDATQSGFDVMAFYAAMDAERQARGLSWKQVADRLWQQSDVLNERRKDHPISASTLTNIARRRDTTCQHALFILRWLGRSPEDFFAVPPAYASATALPLAGRDQRLRWNLLELARALDEGRQQRGLTWAEAAREIRCTPSQLTGIKTARYAIGMRLAMRIVRWLERPAADFIYAANW